MCDFPVIHQIRVAWLLAPSLPIIGGSNGDTLSSLSSYIIIVKREVIAKSYCSDGGTFRRMNGSYLKANKPYTNRPYMKKTIYKKPTKKNFFKKDI